MTDEEAAHEAVKVLMNQGLMGSLAGLKIVEKLRKRAVAAEEIRKSLQEEELRLLRN